MKLLFVRHAEPDYSIDSLTEKGWREAELLSRRLCKLDVKAFYCSTMGRARDTASPTLKKLGRTAEEYDWLREFNAYIMRPDDDEREHIAWDWLPQDWTPVDDFYRDDRWFLPERMAGVKAEYDRVTSSLDDVLAKHGYVRSGRAYRAERPNNDTIVFFCHFGVQCVLLSRLTGISPMILWHNFCAAPSSVTTVITEERREGTAIFRINSFGDVSHLYAAGEPVSFSARFRECYMNDDERRD